MITQNSAVLNLHLIKLAAVSRCTVSTLLCAMTANFAAELLPPEQESFQNHSGGIRNEIS
jgi:hypothetical protein